MKPKKVALILPTLHAGGMERVMAELANYFESKKNIEVHFVLFGHQVKIFYQLNSNIIIHQSNIKSGKNIKIRTFINTIKFIRNTISQISPDAVLTFGTQWNNLVLLSLFLTKYRIFISDRGAPDRVYKFPQEHLKKILYPKASGIIAQTKTAESILKNRFPSASIKTIGNPIRDIGKGKFKENFILSVGRLITSKHHDRLIEIFQKLNAPGWKLVIVGGNALKQNNLELIKDKINKSAFNERIILTGEKTNVEEFYRKSKIFAFTSSVEGFPNVVGEALSAGLPVVSYDCIAGPSDMIINGENGFLVPVFDDVQFQEKLQLLIDNEVLREKMESKAIEKIKKYSVESIGQQYLDFILS
jgi:GalNAc-alpha-(1->4)-GalNAc-alpha-(1->3)-diNAcBac-PP-undecaprenol alpha-1,4-N-acetyl-D-galactosaminyltransferase